MKKKILFFTGSRADYGILKPLITKVIKKNYAKVELAAAGQHFSKIFGNTYQQILKDKIKINHRSKINLKKTNLSDIIKYLSKSLLDYYKILNKTKPNLVVILGDRYEVFCFAVACYLLNIRIAHLHGGELTYGAFDDGLRHSITKLSDFHFVSHLTYKKRVIQLGENPKKVFNVGALAMDNMNEKDLCSKDFLLKKFNIKTNKKLALVTFHPVTKNNDKYKTQVKNFLDALNQVDYYYIFTYNNSDTLGKDFIKKIIKFSNVNKNSKVFKTLGTKLYLSFIKHSDLVVGNSSSGIYEAPALKTVTLNVGNRQEGRIFGPSIINCKNETKEIVNKLRKIYNKKLKVNFKNLFYKKDVSGAITNEIKKIINKKLEMKKFYDIKF